MFSNFIGLKPKSNFFLLVPLSVIVFIFAFNLYFINKVFPGVSIAGEKISGMTKQEAKMKLESKISDFESSKIVLEVSGKSYDLNVSELGVSFNSQESANKAFSLGRTGDIREDIIFRARALFRKSALVPAYNLDFSRLSEVLSRTLQNEDQEPKDALLSFSNGQVTIEDGVQGEVVDKSNLIANLKDRVEKFSTAPVQVLKIKSDPVIRKQHLQEVARRTGVLANQRFVFKFGSETFNLPKNSLFEMLRYFPSSWDGDALVKIDFVGTPIVVRNVSFEGLENKLDVKLNDQKIDEYLAELSQQIDKPTVDADLKFENGKVSFFKAAQDGQQLNIEQAKRLLLEKLSIDNKSNDILTVIALPVEVTKAKIANDEVAAMGIRELVGRGVSYFAGSIANRAYNVGLGASRLSGALVKPGEVFSFNNAVGEVSGTTGYRKAYVISEGRTILDDGGGICQVSTTVFRAALSAGLPIVTRTAHAYRVGYYEQRGVKPGYDATVWAPSVDFQFKNDTEHYLLVQAVVDQENARLEVDIYGTADGRKVDLGDSVVVSQSPALPDKYQDDPTLPKGTVKQVDFAAPGAIVYFTRKVTKGSHELYNDTFRSVYRPWQAIYLVGQKD